VPEDQLSLAIGKQGLNVRLANRLADWNIDVKTMDQFDEMDIAADSKRAVSALFGDRDEPEDEITSIRELPGITDQMVAILEGANITMIEEIVGLSDDDLRALDGMTEEIVADLSKIIAENVEIVEEPDEEYDYDDEEYDDEEDETDGAGEDADTDGPEDEPEEYLDEEIVDEEDEEDEEEVIEEIDQLPGMTETIVARLKGAGVVDLDDLISLNPTTLREIEGLTDEEAETIRTILTEYVEIVEDDEDQDD
jgi:transcription termination/antitermination protein NusA